jgi:hypothetical protein
MSLKVFRDLKVLKTLNIKYNKEKRKSMTKNFMFELKRPFSINNEQLIMNNE